MFAILAYYDGNEMRFEQIIIPEGMSPQDASQRSDLLEPQVAHKVELISAIILTPDVDNTQIIYDGEVVYGELD
jgi:hypothetical protein